MKCLETKYSKLKTTIQTLLSPHLTSQYPPLTSVFQTWRVSTQTEVMEEHHWNIALVVISLLSLVLLLTTFIVIACVKRENKRFYKRFAAKSSSLEQNDDVDMELKDLILKLSNCLDLQDKLNLRSVGRLIYI